jgi:hypothetical protein
VEKGFQGGGNGIPKRWKLGSRVVEMVSLAVENGSPGGGKGVPVPKSLLVERILPIFTGYLLK